MYLGMYISAMLITKCRWPTTRSSSNLSYEKKAQTGIKVAAWPRILLAHICSNLIGHNLNKRETRNKRGDKLETTAKESHPTCSVRKMAIEFGVLCTSERRALTQKRKHVHGTKSHSYSLFGPQMHSEYTKAPTCHIVLFLLCISTPLAGNQKKKQKKKKKRNVLVKGPCVTWGPFLQKTVRILST